MALCDSLSNAYTNNILVIILVLNRKLFFGDDMFVPSTHKLYSGELNILF